MENDPAADFLAREQQQLADLDDTDDVSDAPQNNIHQSFQQQNGFANDYASATNNGVVDDDFLLMGGTNSTEHFPNGSAIEETNREEESSGRDYSYHAAPVSRSPPANVRAWFDEQKKRLDEKDKAEDSKNRELRDQAQKELDDWHRLWNDNLTKRKKTNREHEKSVAEANSGDTSGDPNKAWERIASLCDFSGSQKVTTNVVAVPGAGNAAVNKSDTSTRDISRMKSLLLQLKQKPPKQSSSSSS